MNTTAHLIFGAAIFGSSRNRMIVLAALAGALTPDVSLYLMAGFAMYVLEIPASVVFDELYYSKSWQTVFSIDNSFLLWGLLLVYAVCSDKRWLLAFAAAGLLHIGTDFFLHNEDARAHFWPVSDWRFRSPVSYWDSHRHALWVAPLEAVLCAALVVVLWLRHVAIVSRVLIVTVLAAEIWIVRQWILFF